MMLMKSRWSISASVQGETNQRGMVRDGDRPSLDRCEHAVVARGNDDALDLGIAAQPPRQRMLAPTIADDENAMRAGHDRTLIEEERGTPVWAVASR